jgi:hypothetical protein
LNAREHAIDKDTWKRITAHCNSFRNLQRFLLQVVLKLAEKGHANMQDLAFRLDFNDYYADMAATELRNKFSNTNILGHWKLNRV